MAHVSTLQTRKNGKQLRALRKEAGVSAADFVRVSGLARSTVGFVENGQYTPDTLRRYVEGLEALKGGTAKPAAHKVGRKSTLDSKKPREALLLAAGLVSWQELCRKARPQATGFGFLQAMQAGKLPPNHPYLPAFAAALNISLDTFAQTFAQGAPMADQQVRRLSTLDTIRKPGNALIMHPTASSVAKASGARRGRPPGVARLGRGAPGVRRNTLKRQELGLREATRGIVMTLNTQIMFGHETIELPTAALTLVLEDYFGARHVKGPVVLPADWAERFG